MDHSACNDYQSDSEEDYDALPHDEEHLRAKRDTSPEIESYGRRSRKGRNRQGKQVSKPGERMTPVRMPNRKDDNEKVEIIRPDMSNFECGDPTQLIEMTSDDPKWGREYNIVKEQMEATKRTHPGMSISRYDIIKMEKIINGCWWTRYRKRQSRIRSEADRMNEYMMFHGTTSAMPLLTSGLGFDERFGTIEGMFGAGIYFAEHSSKSNQYTFGTGWNTPCKEHNEKNCDKCIRTILFCRVTLGNIKEETSAKKVANPPPGYHSVMGKPTPGGLNYAEYIVYRGEQVYPEYLITYKTVK